MFSQLLTKKIWFYRQLILSQQTTQALENYKSLIIHLETRTKFVVQNINKRKKDLIINHLYDESTPMILSYLYSKTFNIVKPSGRQSLKLLHDENSVAFDTGIFMVGYNLIPSGFQSYLRQEYPYIQFTSKGANDFLQTSLFSYLIVSIDIAGVLPKLFPKYDYTRQTLTQKISIVLPDNCKICTNNIDYIIICFYEQRQPKLTFKRIRKMLVRIYERPFPRHGFKYKAPGSVIDYKPLVRIILDTLSQIKAEFKESGIWF